MNYLYSLIWGFFGSALVLTAQVPLEKESVLDSIPVSPSEQETFALYLPSYFDENSLSPVVFVFDPAARGSKGLEPFIPAAEKYGLIVICSNSSRNSSLENNFKIANRLFDTVFKTFQIKENEMFLAGFSGGSRLATAIACLTNKFFGVIACGAGFSSTPAHIPSTQSFLYAGLVGTADMNYSEMLRNKKILGDLNFTNTLFTFDAGHSWPTGDQISAAFDWLYLQHEEKIKDPLFVRHFKHQYKQVYDVSLKSEKEGQLLFAAENYERLIKTYNTLFDVDSIAKKYRVLLGSKPFKKANKELSRILVMENKLRKRFQEKLKALIKEPNTIDYSWWFKEVAKLDKLKDSGGSEIKNMVKRIKYSIVAAAYEWNGSPPDKWGETYKTMFKGIQGIVYPNKIL